MQKMQLCINYYFPLNNRYERILFHGLSGIELTKLCRPIQGTRFTEYAPPRNILFIGERTISATCEKRYSL